MSPEKRLEYLGTVSNYTRLEVIGQWQEIMYEERIAGDLYWFVHFSRQLSPALRRIRLTLWMITGSLGLADCPLGIARM